jgi:hypothetical protein
MRRDYGVQLKVHETTAFCDERMLSVDGAQSGVEQCLAQVAGILSEDAALKQHAHVDYQPPTIYAAYTPLPIVKGKGKGQVIATPGYRAVIPSVAAYPPPKHNMRAGALSGMPPRVTDHQLALCFNVATSSISKLGNVQRFGKETGTIVMLGGPGSDPDEQAITVTGTLRACQSCHAKIVEACNQHGQKVDL